MAKDYGNDYADVAADGTITMDLSASKITGPLVPVVRVARALYELISEQAIEGTFSPAALSALDRRLTEAANAIEHVQRATIVLTLKNKVLRCVASCYLDAGQRADLFVTVDEFGQTKAGVL